MSGGRRLRALITAEAARVMFEEDVKEYFTAKRMAARRVLGRERARSVRYRPEDLPSNGEIREALLALARRVEGAGRTTRLFAMRVLALRALEALAPFEPRLIGSVSTGHVRRGSDIDVSIFCDHEERVEVHLAELGWSARRERVTIHKFGEVREYVHYQTQTACAPAGDPMLELTLYPRRELRFRPRSSTDGKPIVRVTRAALTGLLEREHANAWARLVAGATLEDAATERDARGEDDGWDPSPCVALPGEEDDPTEAYEPLAGFESWSAEDAS